MERDCVIALILPIEQEKVNIEIWHINVEFYPRELLRFLEIAVKISNLC